MEDND